MDLTPSIDAYLHHLEFNRRVTSTSLKNYRSSLRRFETFCVGRGYDNQAIQDYVACYKNPASANVVMCRLNGLVEYVANPDKRIRAKEPVKEAAAITAVEVTAVADAADEPSVRALTIFLFETGLRFGEYVALNEQSAKRSGTVRYLAVVGKGRKHRRVPLSAAAFAAFGDLEFGPTAWRQEVLRTKLAEAGVRAGISIHVHPHLLRASMISHLLNEKGVEAIKVAKIVGHSSVDTMLKHYYRATIESLSEAVQ